MLAFQSPVIEMRDAIKTHCAKSGYMSCEYAFGNLFMWKEYANTGICFEDDLMYMISNYEQGEPAYRMPAGNGNMKLGLEKMIVDANEKKIKFKLACVTQDMREQLETIMPGAFTFIDRREYADYIYKSEDLITLGGKKLHAKRNHLNKCLRQYADICRYETINENNIDEIIAFNNWWYEQNLPGAEDSLHAEKTSTQRCLVHCREIGLIGGAIWLGSKLVAYTYGSELNADVFVIHVEKADTEYDGAYAAINNYFAKENLSSYKYINREEDMGIEGLRKAKLSYQPEIILMRYDAVLK